MLTTAKLKNETTETLGNQRLKVSQDFQFGYIKSSIDDKYRIEGNTESCTATKAPSCLISPMTGDYVATIYDGSDIFIVAVLKRPDRKVPLTVESEREIAISAPSIRLFGTQKFSLTGQQGFITCSHFNLASRKAELTAEVADTRIGKLSHIGKSLKMAIGDILIRAATSMRIVDKTDFQRARETSIKADKFLSLQGDMTCITARTDVKVDGERIHMG
tara:strand:+ start:422 stop:1075 length:654 start_codon:yes stop_codon:yes gene_type:complete